MSFNTDWVNPKDYGARGDGVTDDTAALQAAINRGLPVDIPLGIFQTSAPLLLATHGQIIRGQGPGTIIRANASFSGTAAVQCTSGEPGAELQDLWITSQVYGGINTGFQAQNTPRFKLTRCRITGFQTTIDMTGNSGGADMNDLDLWASSNSVSIDGCLDTVTMNAVRVWPFDDPGAASITASISGTTLTVTNISAGALGAGQVISGSGVTTCRITQQLTVSGGNGTQGRLGTYQVNVSQTVTSRAMSATGYAFGGSTGISSGRCDVLSISNSIFICLNQLVLFNGAGVGARFLGSISGTTLGITSLTSGTIAAGMTVVGAGIAANTTIVSGAGLSWQVSISQTIGIESMTGGFPGPTICNVTGTDFDSFNGLIMSAGQCQISGSIFTGGDLTATAFGQAVSSNVSFSGGSLTIGSSRFSNGSSIMIGVASTTTVDQTVITGCTFDFGLNPNCGVLMSGGNLNFSHNTLRRTSAVGGNYMITVNGGRATVMGNRCPVDGTGNYIQVTNDDWHAITYNRPGGWTISTPGGATGIYSPN